MSSLNRSHFSEGAWSDFVRELAAASVRSSMEEHLHAGCPECLASLRFVQELDGFARNEQSMQVPEALVASAVSLFRPQQPENWLWKLDSFVAELVQDLCAEGQLVGVRSQGGGPRRLLYRAGPYGLDLSLEPSCSGGFHAVTGQIDHQGGEELGGVVVQVLADGGVVAETRANTFGEFVAEYPSGKAIELRIGFMASRRRLDVPLPAVQ